MDNLTDKEFDVYFAIKDFIRLNQYPPTVRELCSILGYKSQQHYAIHEPIKRQRLYLLPT